MDHHQQAQARRPFWYPRRPFGAVHRKRWQDRVAWENRPDRWGPDFPLAPVPDGTVLDLSEPGRIAIRDDGDWSLVGYEPQGKEGA